VKVLFDTDIDKAMRDTSYWVERAASRWIVSDDPDEHIERIAPYIELGFTHLVFHAPGPDQDRFLRLYAKEILPRLRKQFS
jgi:coenzyme F420-dependent glucose-6-phosphate dehydrogenase